MCWLVGYLHDVKSVLICPDKDGAAVGQGEGGGEGNGFLCEALHARRVGALARCTHRALKVVRYRELVAIVRAFRYHLKCFWNLKTISFILYVLP